MRYLPEGPGPILYSKRLPSQCLQAFQENRIRCPGSETAETGFFDVSACSENRNAAGKAVSLQFSSLRVKNAGSDCKIRPIDEIHSTAKMGA
jgi:hypothetical protein